MCKTGGGTNMGGGQNIREARHPMTLFEDASIQPGALDSFNTVALAALGKPSFEKGRFFCQPRLLRPLGGQWLANDSAIDVRILGSPISSADVDVARR